MQGPCNQTTAMEIGVLAKLQVRESSVLDSYHRTNIVSSLDADHGNPPHPLLMGRGGQ